MWYTNPQTTALCELLGVDNNVNPPPGRAARHTVPAPAPAPALSAGKESEKDAAAVERIRAAAAARRMQRQADVA